MTRGLCTHAYTYTRMARWRDPIDTGGIAAGTPFYFTAIPPLHRTPETRESFEEAFVPFGRIF